MNHVKMEEVAVTLILVLAQVVMQDLTVKHVSIFSLLSVINIDGSQC